MKKVYLLLLSMCFGLSYGQFNEAAPWMHKDPTAEVHRKRTRSLDDFSDSFKTYWRQKDHDYKGSGYKPFKRWENHWSNFLKKDGSLMTPESFWKAWEQEKNLSKSEFAAWRSVGPFTTVQKFGQGRINTFIIDPNNDNVFYSGAPSGGLWRSTDYGENWEPLTDEIPQIGVSGIAIDPNDSDIIYITTGDDDAGDTYSIGVMKSTDRGATWNKTGLEFTGSNEVASEIYMHPDNSDILWVATSRGFFKTTDAGKNWDFKISIEIQDIKLKPGDPDVIYAVSTSLFYKSTDGGETFKVISNGLPTSSGRMAIDVSPDNPEVVYLLSANLDNSFQGVYRSQDSGESFEKTRESSDIFGGSTQAWYDMAITVNPDDADMVFVGVLDIWRSGDGGDSFLQMNRWYDRSEPSYTHADIHFMRYFNDKLYAGTDGGIYESADNALTFTDLTETMNISQYYRISTASRNAGRIVGGLQDNGGFAYRDNTWNQYHDGDGMDCVVDPNDQNVYYGFSQFGARLNVTYNGGISSGGTVVEAPGAETGDDDSGGNWITPLASDNEGNLYAGYSRLYQLVNDSWEAISPRMFGGNLNCIAISTSVPETIYVSRLNRLFKSSDKGDTFEQLEEVFPSIVSSIEVNNQNDQVVYATTTGDDGRVFRSEDGGATWEDISANLPEDPKLVIKHQSQSPDNDLYVGTSIGVYHRNDKMSEWERYDEGLPNAPVYDLEINVEDQMITAGTYGRGVWQSPIEVNKVARDLSLLSIDSNNSVQCSGISPVITVRNNGIENIGSINITYRVDGIPYTFDYAESLASEETRQIVIPGNPSIEQGLHSLEIEATTQNDAYPANDILFASFRTNYPGEGKYVNTFGDVNDDVWLTETLGSSTELWERGDASTSRFRSKFDKAYVTKLSGDYFNETTSYLISPCYDLSRLENPILRFDMIYDIEENWDVLYLEYSTDSGMTWSILGTADDPNWYNSDFIDPQRPITVGRQWTGTDIDPKEYSYDLSGLASEKEIIFRFVFASDQSVTGEGALIDNFSIDATTVLAADEFEDHGFKLYPNPSSSVFYINRKGFEPMQISVYDVTGRLILVQKDIEQQVYPLNLGQVKSGLYFLHIREGRKNLATTLLKQ